MADIKIEFVTDPKQIDDLIKASFQFRLLGCVHVDPSDRLPGCRSHLKVRRTKDGRWLTRRGAIAKLRLTHFDHVTSVTAFHRSTV
jgi:hypothetical protein